MSLTCFYLNGGTPLEVFQPEMAQSASATTSVRPPWQNVALAGAETIAILLFGLFVARHFDRGYTIGLVSTPAKENI